MYRIKCVRLHSFNSLPGHAKQFGYFFKHTTDNMPHHRHRNRSSSVHLFVPQCPSHEYHEPRGRTGNHLPGCPWATEPRDNASRGSSGTRPRGQIHDSLRGPPGVSQPSWADEYPQHGGQRLRFDYGSSIGDTDPSIRRGHRNTHNREYTVTAPSRDSRYLVALPTSSTNDRLRAQGYGQGDPWDPRRVRFHSAHDLERCYLPVDGYDYARNAEELHQVQRERALAREGERRRLGHQTVADQVDFRYEASQVSIECL